MRTFVHIGPHKTGTTSLQAALLSQYGAATPQPIWYPQPETAGPGHAALAHELRRARTASAKALVKTAVKGGCEKLILSSEDFSLLCAGRFHRLKTLAGPDGLTIVVTMTPLRRRAYALWQEQVKHGSLQDQRRALRFMLRQPTMIGSLLDLIVDAWDEADIVLAIGDAAAPEILFDRVSQALSVPIELPDQPRMNASFGIIETELLRTLNLSCKKHGLDADKRWRMVGALATMFDSPMWKDVEHEAAQEIPREWEAAISGVYQKMVESVGRLSDEGRLTVLGEIEHLAAR